MRQTYRQTSRPAIGLLLTALSLTAIALPAAHAETPVYAAKLVNEGTITIATTGNAPPITQTKPDGSLDGYDVELCRTIAADLGLKANFVRVDFAATIPGLTAGRFDMICSATARTPARLASPDLFMTSPTLQNFSTLLVPADSKIATVADIKGKKVGTVRGGQEAKLITEDYGSDVELTTYPGIAEETMDLKNGRIDAVALNFVTGSYTAKMNPGLKVLNPGFVKQGVSPYDHALIVSRAQPALLEAVNTEIAKLKAAGTLDQLQQKWISAN